MKKGIFENSDFIVVLPGGIGVLSEVLSFIEENRSNDKEVPIIIYDENRDYQFLWNQLEYMVEKGFASDITDYVTISHNRDEFEQSIEKIISKKGKILR